MVTSPTVYWEEQRCCQDLQRLRIFPHLQQVLLSRVLGPLPPVGLVDQQLDVVLVNAHLEHQSTALLPCVTSQLTLQTLNTHQTLESNGYILRSKTQEKRMKYSF